MTVTRRYYANAAPQRTLASGITSSATTLAISGTFAGWPVTFPFYAALEYGTASVEIVSVTAITGATATIVRGQDGSAAISHNAGATLDQVVVARDLDEANAHNVATAAVHGVAGTVVGTTDVQTLTNKTLTSPVVNTPTVNTPTITNGTASKLLQTGDATTAAVRAKAAATGRALETQKSDGTVKFTVDGDTGNVATPGTLASGTQTVTGDSNISGNQTVTGNETIAGTLAVTGNVSSSGTVRAAAIGPASYANQAAATAAIPSPSFGNIVWLTSPTGGLNAGFFYWDGTIWEQVARGNIALATFVTNINSTGATEAVGYSQTVPLVAGRTYRVWFRTWVNGFAGNRAGIRIRYDTGTVTATSPLVGEVDFVQPATGSAGRTTMSSFLEFTAPTTATYNVALGVYTALGAGDTTIVGTEFATVVSIDIIK